MSGLEESDEGDAAYMGRDPERRPARGVKPVPPPLTPPLMPLTSLTSPPPLSPRLLAEESRVRGRVEDGGGSGVPKVRCSTLPGRGEDETPRPPPSSTPPELRRWRHVMRRYSTEESCDEWAGGVRRKFPEAAPQLPEATAAPRFLDACGH